MTDAERETIGQQPIAGGPQSSGGKFSKIPPTRQVNTAAEHPGFPEGEPQHLGPEPLTGREQDRE